jgi:hypothetical protein
MRDMLIVVAIIVISAMIAWYADTMIPDPIVAPAGRLLLRDDLLRMSEP